MVLNTQTCFSVGSNSLDRLSATGLGEGLRVLVVDSHTDSTDFLIALFAQFKVETLVATGVSEALEVMQQTCPDLLISELALPDGDGYLLLRKVKVFEAVQSVRIPAIALTTRAKQEDRMHALAAGFCRHISKPLDIDELMATVAYLVNLAQK